MGRKQSTFLERLWLTFIVSGQVIIAPAIAFAATYFIDFGGILGEQPLLRVNLIPWILGAALGYGILSLTLALAVGGWMPIGVAEKGGWLPVLGVSRRLRDASMVDRARLQLLNSPHGKLMQIVHREFHDRKRPLMEVHGGLQLLAAPLQIALAITPLLFLKYVPSEWLVPNRLLEVAMLGYLIALALVLRAFPGYSHKLVGPASSIRRFLVTVTRINWMFPVLLLWLVGRIIVGFAFEWMQPDLSQWQQIAFEKTIFEAFLPVEVEIPETSFLDMLVALALLPMATFTTMAVLGGGREDLPDWLVEQEAQWVDLDADGEDDEGDEEENDGIQEADDEPEQGRGGVSGEGSNDDDGGSDGDNAPDSAKEEPVDLAGALSRARGLVADATKKAKEK
uniref:Uncharacterized protein n=1 Tax=uncultured marine group II/III euryarchaeote KM3_92_B07 TaxID=1456543 RepID=A0A075I1K1_9EURY|nr:hypothetical protein [uncultured marine group II/III euryarchaeote KM3_92_B07]